MTCLTNCKLSKLYYSIVSRDMSQTQDTISSNAIVVSVSSWCYLEFDARLFAKGQRGMCGIQLVLKSAPAELLPEIVF